MFLVALVLLVVPVTALATLLVLHAIDMFGQRKTKRRIAQNHGANEQHRKHLAYLDELEDWPGPDESMTELTARTRRNLQRYCKHHGLKSDADGVPFQLTKAMGRMADLFAADEAAKKFEVDDE